MIMLLYDNAVLKGATRVADDISLGRMHEIYAGLRDPSSEEDSVISMLGKGAAPENEGGRAMARTSLTEYSNDLVFTGEDEFGSADDPRAHSGPVPTGAGAYGARQSKGSASEGSTGKEFSKRGRKPRKKPKRGDA